MENDTSAAYKVHKDIHFENYEDPIRALGGAVTSIWFGVGAPLGWWYLRKIQRTLDLKTVF
ncbi:hypothetical protein [Methanolobus profundi]|uniref:Uncharacterized protein n=1 Tax=Methanolobus profundi TaxID=487685 RepID=A0A1I4STG4_9EURY|nr:hypothetical protein [Methanolobus profundi]SFM67828.1 hypothetical protein SAMN04488696_2008 [Methanolobus profundi]